ncbi:MULTISPECIES: OmpP1/FadL family transporter [unclassified Desulfovibrio]|uniref:OmpP1/FadL family transporter n=1 Tax=unclassified Desulfovibrio TaxID=2593640 RepID=UPI002FD91F22
MKFFRVPALVLALVLCCSPDARSEGFALNEWSARGVALSGGMVGRADDVSTLAYNAAGITQVPGTHVMGGLAFIAPLGTIVADMGNGVEKHTSTKPDVWLAPHGFVSHQLNDRVWLGFASFSRFGLGNSFNSQWVGRYNMYDIGMQTVSFVPSLAYKVNDMLSLSVGVEALYAHVYMGNKIPTRTATDAFDNDLQLEGSGWGVGAHLGMHMRFNDQWSLGLSYKSQITLNLFGDVDFGYEGPNGLITAGVMHGPQARDRSANATLQLPDSIALGIAYKPVDNLSFEVGTVFTRWSTYNALNINMGDDYSAINNKEWRDGWNFNASVEYKPLDWWALRAGFAYETPVVNESYSDYMMPTNGRTMMSLGTGFTWENWTVDLTYAHLWINPVDYDHTETSGIRSPASGIKGGHSENVQANIYMFSVGYSF